MTVLENARLAAQSSGARSAACCARARDDRRTIARGHRRAGTGRPRGVRRDLPAGALSHGQRRLLEIALVLATGARVLLLDEPLAGLGAEETAPVVALLRALAADHAMLLVEHDMDVVFAVADEITVMVDGRVLESGSPDAIRRSAAVRDAYLGHRA